MSRAVKCSGRKGGHRADISDDAHGNPHIPDNRHAEGPADEAWGGCDGPGGNLDA